MTTARLIIGADIVPTKSNLSHFENGDAVHLLGGELLNIIGQAEYRIFNLEAPLTDVENPILKCGPHLIAPQTAVNGYKAIGADLLTLANNHILDQGVEGLASTCQLLDKAGIAYLGVGNTPEEAAKPYILSSGDCRIGVYACAEHEFSIVTEDSPGANPFDPLESFDHLVELKERCDYLVVLYHGGKEHYRYPSPNLQKVCHKLVDKGADLVLCQHTHCVGCEEKYKSGIIVYGQGNFLFDYSESEFWNTGLLVQVNNDLSVSYLPLVKRNEVVRLAAGDEAAKIMAGFEARSQEIQTPGVVAQRYMEFAREMRDNYLMNISGRKNILFRILNKLSGHQLAIWGLRNRYPPQALASIENYLDCEAHRELFLCGIRGGRQ